jgi:SAM-dependent methyltransferase
MIRPRPFEPDRFRTAAAYYERGRVAYAPALIRRVAEVCGLRTCHRVLDLGCGTGPLARAFAPLAAEVLAMDPSPDMLLAARAAAGEAANIRWNRGSSYDLGPAQGRFFLVVMGRSFHWMDRVDTLGRLDGMIDAGGAVALFHDNHRKVPENAWLERWYEVRRRYEPDEEAHHGPDWVRHEAVLLDSPFSRLEHFGVIERRSVTVETLVARALSMSSTSAGRLGERAGAMAAELRASLAPLEAAGGLTEVVMTSALVAWRTEQAFAGSPARR